MWKQKYFHNILNHLKKIYYLHQVIQATIQGKLRNTTIFYISRTSQTINHWMSKSYDSMVKNTLNWGHWDISWFRFLSISDCYHTCSVIMHIWWLKLFLSSSYFLCLGWTDARTGKTNKKTETHIHIDRWMDAQTDRSIDWHAYIHI